AAVERREELHSLLERAEVIDSEVDRAAADLARAGHALTEARGAAGVRLAEAAITHLRELAFSDPVVSVEVTATDPGPAGADTVQLLFASDSRLTPGPVSQVASGGELSRLTLALRLAGGSGETDTYVFDEIDAGIGGGTALSLGRKLADLARKKQVL